MAEDIYSLVGKRVREERLRAGLTLENLAERANISRSFLAYIEARGRKASLETIQHLAEALRLPIADFFQNAQKPRKDHLYDIARKFTQLVRDKDPDEAAAVLEIARAAVKSIPSRRKLH